MSFLIQSAAASLYAGPDAQSPRVDEALHGMEAEVLEEKGEWLWVRMAYGYSGWLRRAKLAKVSDGFAHQRLVTAAAAGRVTEIYYSFESGITMVIDHGNGWSTTYSRLGAETIAQIGDVVYKGEPVAYVGTPPIYSVLLGNHLGFMVTKDNSSVNPNSVCVN